MVGSRRGFFPSLFKLAGKGEEREKEKSEEGFGKEDTRTPIRQARINCAIKLARSSFFLHAFIIISPKRKGGRGRKKEEREEKNDLRSGEES